MGNWHCITSSCATVHYREYESGKIRWRYGIEPWKEIAGDDYSIKVENSYTRDTNYKYVYRYPNGVANNALTWSNDTVWVSGSNRFNGIQSFRLKIIHKGRTFYCPNNKYDTIVRDANGNIGTDPIISQRKAEFYVEVVSQGITTTIYKGSDVGQWAIGFVAVDGVPIPTVCNFKIFKKGVVVYTETRAVCPEVQKIPCKLSTTKKQIEIEKFPYLNRVEVVDYAYDVRLGLLIDIGNYGLLLVKSKIPSECLNIYNNDITSTIPTNFGNFANTPENLYRLVGQICSAPGCPPPEYQVICDCNNCESCPEGTCAVECEGQVCCYGFDGVSVKSIALENYCGGQL
jgi:hypothetical protein